MKKSRILSLIAVVISVMLSIFCVLSVISIFGFNKIFEHINSYQPLSSTHEVEISKDCYGYTTIKNNTNSEPLKVLQITDMHICCSITTYNKDKQAFDTVYQLIKKNNPDFIVITGDAIYPFILTFSTNNHMQANAVGRFFEKVGIAWTMIFGNHDAHGLFKTADKRQLSNYFESLNGCLYERGDENIDGFGNYIIKSLNYDGSLNKVLIFMDSNEYVRGINNYDKIHDNQIKWYQENLLFIAETEEVLVDEIYSLLFIHIPLTAYKTVVDLYNRNSSQIIYHFGALGRHPCVPDVEEDFFSTITELGSTRAVFAGHDHLNNFCIEYKNVLLTYGMSIDFTAYLGIHRMDAQRGGTMIYLNEFDQISIVQAPQSNNYEQLNSGFNFPVI